MPQLVLLTGALLASSIGVALTMLIFRSTTAVMRARHGNPSRPPALTAYRRRRLSDFRDVTARGYDSPELAEEDALIRTPPLERKARLH